jgi:hypothetical protein
MTWVLTGVPWSLLGPVAAAVGASVLLLYALRVRRRRVEVPFGPHWVAVLRRRRLVTLWERLRHPLSLLLQLALAGLLLLALADPRSPDTLAPARSVVLVVDVTASMGARIPGRDERRIDAARREALRVLATLGPQDEVLLARLAGEVEPLTGFVRPSAALAARVEGLEPLPVGGRPAQALRFGLDALRGRPEATLVLVGDGGGDGAVPEPNALPRASGVRVVHLPVGEGTGNLALTAFTTRRYPTHRTNVELLAAVHNHFDVPVEAWLELWAGSTLVDTVALEVPAGATLQQSWSDLPAEGAALRGVLRLRTPGLEDLLATDDQAWAVLPRQPSPRVVLVTEGNLFVEGPLLLQPGMRLERRTEADWRAGPPPDEGTLVVFDGVAPPVSGAGRALWLAPSGPDAPWRTGPDVVDPIFSLQRVRHPLLQHIDGLRDIRIARARGLVPTRADRVVATAVGGAPLLLTREGGGRRDIALAFRPQESDMVLRAAWPIFVLNALDWLLDEDPGALPGHPTGVPRPVQVPADAGPRATVHPPAGPPVDAALTGDTLWVTPDQVGLWRVDAGGVTTTFAASLTDPGESDLTPRRLPSTEDLPVTYTWDDAARPVEDQPPWVLLLTLALGLLALEWVTWNRRVTV